MKTCLMMLGVLGVGLSLTGCVVWPQSQVIRQSAPAPQMYQPAPQGPAISVEDVKALVKAGISDALIVSQIQNSCTVYHLGAADIIALKTAGVSEKVISAMLATQTNALSAPTSTTTVSQTSPAVVESVVVTEPACVYVPAFYPWYWGWGWHGCYGRGPGRWR